MLRSLRNNRAVSQVFAYMLALAITSVSVTASILVMTTTVDQKKDKIADNVAEQIANYVADAILDLRTIREAYPNANYSKVLDIPTDLVSPSYRYIVEICDKGVYVNSTNGKVSRMVGLLNTSQTQFMTINGRVNSRAGALKVYANKTEYVYKFDFGPENSTMPILKKEGYAKISHLCNYSYPILWDRWLQGEDITNIFGVQWDINDWKYRTAITVTNPADEAIDNYQIMVRLDPSNFDYKTANYNGSDIRFIGNTSRLDDDPDELDYWIEVWKPHDTLTSRIWVELNSLPADGTTIYMYHGYEGAQALPSNSSGTRTFDFFENFTSFDGSKWAEVQGSPPCASEVVNGTLHLKGNVSISTNAYTTQENPACIIETKARAIEYFKSSLNKYQMEASMFARYEIDADPRVFYFSSGKNLEDIPIPGNQYLYSDLAILAKDDGGGDVLFQSSGITDGASVDKSLADEDWKRLTFILNSTDLVIARYDYGSYVKEESVFWDISDWGAAANLAGYFGLITNHHLAEAYYDWVYVRKYLGNLSGSTNEEQFPTAYVGGVTSNYYYHWDHNGINVENGDLQSVTNYTLSGTLSKDYVNSSTHNGKFWIKNLLPDQYYTIVLTMGIRNESHIIDNVTLLANSEIIEGDIDIDKGGYESFFFVVKPDANGKIAIQINDIDNPAEGKFWWNICWMTVEKGIRAIYASEGGR